MGPDGFQAWLEIYRPDQAEWLRSHKNQIQRPDYQAACLHLSDMLACVNNGFGPVWKNGELYLE